MADAPINDNPNAVPDASPDVASLEAHIDEELGLPKAETTDEPTADPGAADAGDSTDAAVTTAPDDADAEETPGDAEAGEDDGAVAPDAEPPVEGLFITVQDAAGKDYKITKIEDLPEDFTPKNNRQVIEILNSLGKLETDIATQAAKAEADAAAVGETAREQRQVKAWDSEITELQKQGRLEKPKAQVGTPGFDDDPAVKKVASVWDYMTKTNNARIAAGNPNLIYSFEDAFDKVEMLASKQAEADASKTESDVAKQKAGIIGRSSSSSTETPVYRAGSHSDIWSVPV